MAARKTLERASDQLVHEHRESLAAANDGRTQVEGARCFAAIHPDTSIIGKSMAGSRSGVVNWQGIFSSTFQLCKIMRAGQIGD